MNKKVFEPILQEIFNLDYLAETLELRIRLLKDSNSIKNQFQRNEDEIMVYDTKNKLFQVKRKQQQLLHEAFSMVPEFLAPELQA